MNIALAAHDNKKILMENLCIAYRQILCKHNIYATGTTGRIIENAAGITVHKYLEGQLGGRQQLGTHITYNGIDLVIFLCDPTTRHELGADIIEIMSLCDTNNVPFASNLATAEALLLALDRGDLDWREAYK